jgi:hypothetical protein
VRERRAREVRFVAGSMYWASGAFLARVVAAVPDLAREEALLEPGYRVNDVETYTHAWEYLLSGVLCDRLGFSLLAVPA